MAVTKRAIIVTVADVISGGVYYVWSRPRQRPCLMGGIEDWPMSIGVFKRRDLAQTWADKMKGGKDFEVRYAADVMAFCGEWRHEAAHIAFPKRNDSNGTWDFQWLSADTLAKTIIDALKE